MSTPSGDVGSDKLDHENPPDGSRFVHSRLKDPQKDIRLFELLPGSFQDDIRLRIFHTALPEPKKEAKRPMTRHELQNTLPQGWKMHVTQGQYLYGCTGTDGLKTTWTHPDSTYHHLLEETPLEDNHQARFEAISYARGSAQNPQQVHIECPSKPSGFASLGIGQNLASALRHLRHEKEPRTLWADAVCIDRSSPEERNAHVLRIADIFLRASRVVAWLGPSFEDSEEACTTLQHLGEQVVLTGDGWVPAPDATEPDWYRPAHRLPFSEEKIGAIEKLLRRDWFQRMWVLQEIVLASSQSVIQCGGSQMPWLIFSNAICSLHSRRSHFSSSFYDTLQAPVQMTPDPRPLAISDVLRKYRTRQTTDPRDKVYGLLGLLPPEFRQKIAIQYDAPVAKVYMDTALALIEHTKRLDLLGAWNPEDPDSECPSWALDFREPEAVRKPLSYQFCSLSSPCHVRFQPPNELRVTGRILVTIMSGSRMPPVDKSIWDGTDEDMVNIVRKLPDSDIDTAKYGTGEPLREAYAMTLVAGNVRSRFPHDTGLADLDEWQLQNSLNALFGEHAVEGVSDVENLLVSERDALDKLIGRSLSKFQYDFIGLCPRAANGEPEGRYKVIGECYVHGLNDGGALVGLLSDPWYVKIFRGYHGLPEYGFWHEPSKKWGWWDPRLPKLNDDEWEETWLERTRNDPTVCQFYRNKVTGEVTSSDPRLELEALKEMGVKLEEIVLI